MEESPRKPSIVLHVVLGLPLGIIGLIASVVWYYHIKHSGDTLAGMTEIGPVLLGMCSIILTIWAILLAISMAKVAKERYEDEDI